MFKKTSSSAGASGYQEYTLATLPSASAAAWSGRHILCTDLAGGTVLRSNGTRWRPPGGVLVLAGSNTAATLNGTTAKTALATIALPHQLLGYSGAAIKVDALWSCPNSGNNKSLRVELGATSFALITATSSSSWASRTIIRIRSAASQLGLANAVANGVGTTVSVVTTGTEDLNTAKNIVLSSTLALGSETVTLEGYHIRLILP